MRDQGVEKINIAIY